MQQIISGKTDKGIICWTTKYNLKPRKLQFFLEAVTTGISEGKVTYKDATRSKKSIRADSVIIYAGLSLRMDEAMKFSEVAD